MPTNVTPTTAFSGPIKVPNAGETADQSSLRQFVDPLANQVQYLANLTLGATPSAGATLSSGAGVKRLRTVSGTSAMAALTGATEDDICVAGATGLYRYVPSYPGTADSFTIVDSSGTPGGKWVLVDQGQAQFLLQIATGRTSAAGIPSTDGIVRIRTVASTSALSAISSPLSGDVAQVRTASAMTGLYVYAASSSATVDGVNVIDGPSGVGRWLATWRGAWGAAGGIAPLDSTTRVPHANSGSRFVGEYRRDNTDPLQRDLYGTQVSGPASWATLSGGANPEISFSVRSGDWVTVSGHVHVTSTSTITLSSTCAKLRVVFDAGSGDSAVLGSEVATNLQLKAGYPADRDWTERVPVNAVFQVPSGYNGTCTVRLQLSAGAGADGTWRVQLSGSASVQVWQSNRQ